MKALHFRLFIFLALLAVLLTAGMAATPTPARAAAAGIAPTQVRAAPQGTGCSYYVRYGDNLFRIALRFGISYYQLAQMNALMNPNWIFAGQRLNVPCGTGFPPPPVRICAWHIVEAGQYVKQIAGFYGVTWESIAAVNHLYNPNLIYPGMRLAIPCWN